MSVSLHLRPVALPLSSLQLRLQSLHVLPVDVRPVAFTLVSSATQKILAVQAGCCGTACMTRELSLTVLQRKQTSTVNVRAGHSMYSPWPPSIVSSPTPKRTCSAWRLLSYRTQAMGSLSVCSSTEICGCKCHRMYDVWVLRLSSLQLQRILAVQAGDCHCLYHPWPLFSCSSTEHKLSSTEKASAKLAVSVVRLSLRVHHSEKKIAEMWKWWPFFPWFLRSSSSRFSKSAIILSLWHMARPCSSSQSFRSAYAG